MNVEWDEPLDLVQKVFVDCWELAYYHLATLWQINAVVSDIDWLNDDIDAVQINRGRNVWDFSWKVKCVNISMNSISFEKMKMVFVACLNIRLCLYSR